MKTTQTEPVTDSQRVLKYLRKECKFTKAQLAVLLFVTPRTIHNWHSGKTPINKKCANTLEGLFTFLSVMRVSLEARKMFASGYLQGRMSHGK